MMVLSSPFLPSAYQSKISSFALFPYEERLEKGEKSAKAKSFVLIYWFNFHAVEENEERRREGTISPNISKGSSNILYFLYWV